MIEFKSRLQQDPYAADARFGLGKELLAQGDPRSAEREFARALELGLDPNLVLPSLARSWLTLGRSKELIESYGATALSQPKAAAELKAALALAYANTGQPRKARGLIEEAINSDPQSAPAQVLQAQVAMADGRTEDALQGLQRTLATHPGFAAALELQGDILLMVKGDRKLAVSAYERALASEPRSLAVHSKLIATALEVPDLVTAQSRLQMLKRAAPGSLPDMYFSARVQHAAGDLVAARTSIERTLAEYPKDLRSLLLAAEIELKGGAPRTAEDYLATALTAAPTQPRIRHLLATTYLRLGTPEKAQMILEPLVRSRRDDPIALGLSAEAAMQTGLTHVATRLFERAAAAEPTNPRHKLGLALARINRGDFAGGIGELESAVAADRTAFSDMALVSARLHAGDLPAAIKAAAGVARKQPDRPMPEWLLGRLNLKSRQLERARQHFERAIELDRAYVPAAISLAEMDLDNKDAAAALRRFEAVLALDSRNLEALLAMAEIRHRSGESSAKVSAAFESVVTLHPNQPRAWLSLVNHLLRAGQGSAGLLAAQRAGTALPDDLTITDALGRAQLAAGESAQALSTFRRIISQRPRSAAPHLRMADVYLSRHEIDSAIESLKQAIALKQDLLDAQIRLAGLYTVKKNWNDALRVATDVQRRLPRDPQGFHLEGLVHAAQAQWDAAFALYRKAAQRGESAELMVVWHGALVASKRLPEAHQLARQWIDKRPQDTYFVAYLGNLALAEKDFAAAERHFTAILKNEPNNAGAMNNLAWALNQQSKPGATELARKAVSIQPGRADFLDTLSMALARDNLLADAVVTQKRALELDPNTPMLRLNMARLAVKAGDYAVARVQLDKLSALGKAFPDQAEVWQLRQQLP